MGHGYGGDFQLFGFRPCFCTMYPASYLNQTPSWNSHLLTESLTACLLTPDGLSVPFHMPAVRTSACICLS